MRSWGLRCVFVVQHADVLAPLLSRTVACRHSIVTVNELDTVIHVFNVMVANHLTAVPILDSDGRFVTPITISDIRLILLTKDFPLLSELLQIRRHTSAQHKHRHRHR